MQPSPLLSPERLVVDQLRGRWLTAIFESGAETARADAVQAFMERMRCTRSVAEDLVDRAWTMLNLRVHARNKARAA